MQFPQTVINSKGQDVTLTWIKSGDLKDFTPYFQVYGIVFNPADEILIIQDKGKWKIPGGTPEAGETAIEALKRELVEEADVEIGDIFPLGAQRVDYPNNPNVKEGDLYYQLRFVCLVDKILPQTPDPDNGFIYPRRFVTASKITEYVNWGDVGRAMFADAYQLFLNKTKNR